MPESFFISGIVLGLSAGFSPGPLFALVLSESMRAGSRAGIMVALAPLLTDSPIILLSLWLVSLAHTLDPIVPFISLIGALYLFYLAYSSMTLDNADINIDRAPKKALWRGLVANLTNPHPYLFWLGIGAPLIYRSLDKKSTDFLLFLGGFYLCLIGSKIFLAVSAGTFRKRLADKTLFLINRFLGIMLFFFGLVLLGQTFFAG